MEIVIAVFIGVWLSAASFLSYLFIKKESKQNGDKGGKNNG